MQPQVQTDPLDRPLRDWLDSNFIPSMGINFESNHSYHKFDSKSTGRYFRAVREVFSVKMKEIKLKTETFKVLKIKIVENNLVLSFPNSLPERPQDCFVLRIMPN